MCRQSLHIISKNKQISLKIPHSGSTSLHAFIPCDALFPDLPYVLPHVIHVFLDRQHL